MFIRQFFVKGLAHASYLVGCVSSGVCVVIDPKRDVADYLEVTQEEGMKLTHIFETHLHADFVSGHLELANKTGARVYVPAAAQVGYEHVPIREGDEISLGTLRVRIIGTPGHTPESVCLAVSDTTRSVDPWVIFTGDTLFVGDVGRPDLFGPERARELAASLYQSLHNKLLKLPDSVEVYPAHGAGSLCGRSIGSKQSSTIGFERLFNYALQPRSQDDFIELLIHNMPSAPAYFKFDTELNRKGPKLLMTLAEPKSISPRETQEMVKKDNIILIDTRAGAIFGEAHIPGSLNIGLSPQFPTWVGTVIDPEKPLLFLLSKDENLKEVRLHLARIGFDNLLGFVAGGITAWQDAGLPVSSLPHINVSELKELLKTRKDMLVLDVRSDAEWRAGHIKDAAHIPLKEVEERYPEMARDRATAVICGSGYRSSIAASILEKSGLKNLRNVTGGMGAWKTAGYETVA